MRKILFRGKRVDNGAWVEGDFASPSNIVWTERGFDEALQREEMIVCDEAVDPETVGEFTGLCDKNGKGIFEGDIVKFNHNLYKCEVIYENGTFGLASNETLEPFSYEDYGMCDNFISLWEIYWNWDDTDQTLSDVELIGSIHTEEH